VGNRRFRRVPPNYQPRVACYKPNFGPERRFSRARTGQEMPGSRRRPGEHASPRSSRRPRLLAPELQAEHHPVAASGGKNAHLAAAPRAKLTHQIQGIRRAFRESRPLPGRGTLRPRVAGQSPPTGKPAVEPGGLVRRPDLEGHAPVGGRSAGRFGSLPWSDGTAGSPSGVMAAPSSHLSPRKPGRGTRFPSIRHAPRHAPYHAPRRALGRRAVLRLRFRLVSHLSIARERWPLRLDFKPSASAISARL
jgi:hypothetical protein